MDEQRIVVLSLLGLFFDLLFALPIYYFRSSGAVDDFLLSLHRIPIELMIFYAFFFSN